MWIGTHTHKIANKISRTLGLMNRLKRPWNWCIICWSFRTFNLELHTGALIWITYRNCKNGHFGSWQTADTMRTQNLFFNNYICWKSKIYFRCNAWHFGTKFWIIYCQIIPAICLNIIMNYTNLGLEILINFSYIQPSLLVLTTLWDIPYLVW